MPTSTYRRRMLPSSSVASESSHLSRARAASGKGPWPLHDQVVSCTVRSSVVGLRYGCPSWAAGAAGTHRGLVKNTSTTSAQRGGRRSLRPVCSHSASIKSGVAWLHVWSRQSAVCRHLRHIGSGHSRPCASRAGPNPSLKLSPNGGPPSPVWRYAVHFRQSGLGVPPSVPA